MPECVFSVYRVHKTGSEGSFSGTIRSMPDFSLEKLIFQNYRETHAVSENLLMTVANFYWMDLAQSITLYPITFDYNRNTKQLFLAGGLPSGDLILQILKEVPLDYLYKDEMFFNYVVAKTKTELSRILGTFQFNYVGGVTINFDMLKEEGSEKLQEIIETIKDEEGCDWFFTSGSV